MAANDGLDPWAPRAQALLELGLALRAAGYHFITVTPETHRRVNERPENREARTLRDVFGWSRPFSRGVVPDAMFELMRRAEIVVPEGPRWRSLVRVSSLDGELFFHSAYPTTAPDSVFFGPDTYRFAAAVLRHLATCTRPRRAIDIGAGAGPGGILVARAAPDAEVVLADINPAALRLAGVNAELAGASKFRLSLSDVFAAIEGSFDLIVSNPPYLLDPLGRAYRHGAGELGAGLSLAILGQSLERLSPGGALLLYTGSAIVDGADGFRTAAEQLVEARRGVSLSYREIDPDVFGEELEHGLYARADRIAAVLLTATRTE